MQRAVGTCVRFRTCRRQAAGLVLTAAALALSGCHRGGQQNTEGQAPVVQLTQPQQRTIVRLVKQPSFVESYERSSVFPKMTAYIEKWNVDIGDRVKKGEVLASLFVPELVENLQTKKNTVSLDQRRIKLAEQVVEVAAAEVKAAAAALSESQALLAQYQSQADRWDTEVKRLGREVDRGVVDPQVLLESKNQLRSSLAARDAAKDTILKSQAQLIAKSAAEEQSKLAVDVAKADLEVAQSEERRLEALVGYLVLPAPFDGVITARNANTFDFVLPATGDPSAMRDAPYLSPSGKAAPIYVVERTDVVRVFVDIPEQDANFVQPGSEATVLIRAFYDEPITATVTRTAWSLNVKSRTLRAEIDLPNTGATIPEDLPQIVRQSLVQVKLPDTKGQILPGMYAYGNVVIQHSGVWALRNTELDYWHGRTFYWTLEHDRTVRMEVQTGVSDGEWTEVTNRRLMSDERRPWQPIDGSQQVIAANDLSVLVEGGTVEIAKPATDEKEKPASIANPDGQTGHG